MTFIWLLSLCDFLFTVNVFSCGVDNGRSRRVESSTLTYSHYSYIYLVTQSCSSPAVQYSTVQSSFNNVKWVENRSDLEYDFDRGTVGALVPEAGLIMSEAVVSLLGFSPTTVHWLITHNGPKTNIQAAAALQERIPCRWPGLEVNGKTCLSWCKKSLSHWFLTPVNSLECTAHWTWRLELSPVCEVEVEVWCVWMYSQPADGPASTAGILKSDLTCINKPWLLWRSHVSLAEDESICAVVLTWSALTSKVVTRWIHDPKNESRALHWPPYSPSLGVILMWREWRLWVWVLDTS